MASIDLGDVENDFFYTGPADDELDLLFGRLPRSPAKRATTRTKTVLDLVQANLKHLVSDQLHGLAASVLKEINLRYDVQGLQRIKFAPDVPPAAPKKIGLVNINPLPPGGIVRHCLNMEVGACGVCSLCIGKATLHVREEPAPAPPPPPPREVPPAKGPEFDSNGFEKQPAHDAPPTQPTLHEPLREVETLEMTSEHPTATPTRAALRKLEEHRYAALVSEFEAWESATDEYP